MAGATREGNSSRHISAVWRSEVARECGLSVGYSRRLPSHAGSRAAQWLTEQRVVLSKEKLRDDGLSLSDVAAECGSVQ